MHRRTERKCLQAAVALAALVPLLAGGTGMLRGPAMMHGTIAVPADLESHFRYLSGLLFGIGLAFVACIPAIERQGRLFGALAIIVAIGGAARLAAAPATGFAQSIPFALGMELAVTPLLFLWQRRIAQAAGGG